jgi:putative oxidoreductase
MDTGILIARLILGLGLAAHGAQKLFGWFGGHGLAGTGGFMESLGFRPGRQFALAAGLGEFGGGLLTAAGLLGPVGPAAMIAVMVVAMLTVHRGHGFFAEGNGVELPLLYATGALALAFAGPGAYSLDRLLGIAPFAGPAATWTLLLLAVAAGAANLALRRPAVRATRASP